MASAEEWQAAIGAIDAGDVAALTALVARAPTLARERRAAGVGPGDPEAAGYFARPYLLWYVAENPIRQHRLPANIVAVAEALIAAARDTPELGEALDGALGLVASGCVPREMGVQEALIDALVGAGARPDGALGAALPHGELAAAERLLARGATLTLAAAASTGRLADLARLGPAADPAERHAALMCAAVNRRADAIRALVGLGVEVSAFGAPGYHAHSTALHQAVSSGSADAVRALLEAGADRGAVDRAFGGTPLGWARHFGNDELAALLEND
jgi:peptide-methionine (S)-S-oxide reductase